MLARALLSFAVLCTVARADIQILNASVDYLTEADAWRFYAELDAPPTGMTFVASEASDRISIITGDPPLANDLWLDGFLLTYLQDGAASQWIEQPYSLTSLPGRYAFSTTIGDGPMPFDANSSWEYTWAFFDGADRDFVRQRANPASIPEPSTLGLAAAACLAIGAWHLHRHHIKPRFRQRTAT